MPRTAPDSLLGLPVLTAVFNKGQTMLGNHWELFDGTGQNVGRTRRAYEGVGGKVGKRLAVVTGLSTAGSATTEVLDASGTVVCSVFGKGGERTTATLSDTGGVVIGRAIHEFEVAVTLTDEDGSVLGTVETPPDEQDIAAQLFGVRDAAGREVAAMARDPHAYGGRSIVDDIVVSGYIEMANWEAEQLRHYGFRRSNSYTIALWQGAEIDGPLRSLVAMLPVLAGQLY
jgi:hypothetical protein